MLGESTSKFLPPAASAPIRTAFAGPQFRKVTDRHRMNEEERAYRGSVDVSTRGRVFAASRSSSGRGAGSLYIARISARPTI